MNTLCETNDLLVFSHLHWDLLLPRPHHILGRFAKYRRVYYFEPPIYGMTDIPRLQIRETQENVQVVVPHLPSHKESKQSQLALKELVDELIFEENLSRLTSWYYDVSALDFSAHIKTETVIYDCVELPKDQYEAEILRKADLVFTAKASYLKNQKLKTDHIFSFPDPVDYEHFSQARLQLIEPDDQVLIPHPRVGFYGVIDESIDLKLIAELAQARRKYQFIILGHILNVDSSNLPQCPNIHYLGNKDHHILPLYLSGWDCGLVPFVPNKKITDIAWAKINEYLAAGRPVVSTQLGDAHRPMIESNLMHIGDTTNSILNCLDLAIHQKKSDPEWMGKVDTYLAKKSWDINFMGMATLERELKKNRQSFIHNPELSTF